MEHYLEILDSIGKNDPKGLTSLYDSYGSKFYNYAVKRWQLNEDEAWEVVYKTLETLILKISGYQFESSKHFENFLYKVLLNFIRQHFRRSRKNSVMDIQYVDLNSDGEDDLQISRAIDKKTFHDYYASETIDDKSIIALNEALNQLDVVDKDLLLLRAQNYSYDEIAKLLGIENNQLKVKYLRAKQKLLKNIHELQNK